jgi:WD40 repeat protein
VVAAGEEGAARLYDLADGKELRTFEQAAALRAVSFSPDGKLLAIAGADRSARLWDVAGGAALFSLPHQAEVYALIFSPDGMRLATAGADRLVRIFPLDLEELLRLGGERVTRALTPEECGAYHIEPCR